MSKSTNAAPSSTPVHAPAGISPIAVWLSWHVVFLILGVVHVLFQPVPVPPELARQQGHRPAANRVEQMALNVWYQWDTEHFVQIAERGYRADDGTAAFHPLFPVTGALVGRLVGGNALLGLFIVASICSLLFLIYLERLFGLDLPPEDARRAMLYMVHLPMAYALFAPYTEGMFLLFTTLAFLLVRGGKWWWAGLAGGLATLTRQQGIFLLLPLLWECWEASGRNPRKLFVNWRSALGLGLIPLGLLVWLVYRALALSDVVFDFSKPQTLIYGLLLSRSSTRIVSEQSFVPPWTAIWSAMSDPNLNLIISVAFIIPLVFGWRILWRIRPSYAIYALTIILLSLSLATGTPNFYLGLPRHCLLAFPLAIPLALWGRNWAVDLTVKAVGAFLLMTGVLFFFQGVSWVP